MKVQLATEGKIGSLSAKNRIVMAAVPAGLIAADGNPAPEMLDFYRERARGNAGVIITEAVYVGTAHKEPSLVRQLSLNKNSRTEGLAGLAAAVHQYESKLLVRLWQPSLAQGQTVDGQNAEPAAGVSTAAAAIAALAPAATGWSLTARPDLSYTIS